MGRFLRRGALGMPTGGRLAAVVAAGFIVVLGTSVSASAGSTAASRPAVTGTDGQIILPDLLVVVPDGLTARQVARLRAITGVRDVLTLDGAEIRAGGVRVSAVGVNPSTFRPWVPPQTAANQAFWSDLARGDFVAAAGTAPRFIPGDTYRLAGGAVQAVRFGTAAPLGLTGVDVLVNHALSARLGLVRQVAGLISAPGAGMSALRAQVAQILGASGRIEVLRSQTPAAPVPTGERPASYLQLFEASAAQYCPGLSWTVLAAIGQVESGDGQSVGPSSAGALGPMQFLPSTWHAWGIDAFGQTGPPDIMNPYDAVPSAARLLCADGAAGGGTALASAVYDYNHARWYVREVLALAAAYAAEYS